MASQVGRLLWQGLMSSCPGVLSAWSAEVLKAYGESVWTTGRPASHLLD